jgi:hypothetical protein
LFSHLSVAREQSPAEARGDGVVYLNEDDGGDCIVCVDEAEGGAAGVEGLRYDDTADHGGMDFAREVIGEEVGAGSVAPAPVKHESEREDVAPIDEERGAVADEFGQKRCRKRREADGAEKTDVNPCQIAVGAGEVVELGLLADPEDAVGHDAHQEDEQARGECDERAAKVVLGVDGFGRGDTKVETEQGHGDGEDAVAERRDALDALTGNTVVERVHPRESSTGGARVGSSSKVLPLGSLRLFPRSGAGPAVLVMVCILSLTGRGKAQTSQPEQNPNQNSKQGQELPDAPDESKKKEQSGNPMVMTKDAATAGLKKARDWESGWIAGEYVGRNRKLVTPTREQREEIYLRQTLTTPQAYVKRMFAAVIDQARGVPYQWQGGWGGYGERFASREGQFIAANSLAALGNAKLGYEVRYDQCKCHGLWPRTKHAFIRNLVTYDRSEEHLRPQLALYAGAFGGGMISTAWKPSPKNAYVNGGRAAAEQVGWGTLLNFFTEFSREINRKQGVR